MSGAVAALLAMADLAEWEVVARLAAAAGLAGAIGLQRELAGHDAGIRTHALLSLGAALFGVMSVNGFARYVETRAETNVQVDVTRIASYVAAGVGFLAGGVIVKHADRVKGLTTASSLWVAAGVGLACGLGSYLGAVTATVIAVLGLLLAGPLETVTRRRQRRSMLSVVTGSDPAELLAWLRERAAAGRGTGAVLPTLTVTRRAGAVSEPASVEIVVQGMTAAEAHALAEDVARRGDVDRFDVITT